MDRRESFFDHLAPAYDLEQYLFYAIRGWEIRRVHQTLPRFLTRAMSALEIGAGTGRFTCHIAPQVKQICAMDISKKMLSRIDVKAAKKNLRNITTLHGDMTAITVAEQFDAVVSFSAIEYIADHAPLFTRIGNLVKPGGFVYITTAHHTALRSFIRFGNSLATGVSLRASTLSELNQLLLINNFTIIELKDFFLKTPITKGLIVSLLAQKNHS